jgi:hypothetical protein
LKLSQLDFQFTFYLAGKLPATTGWQPVLPETLAAMRFAL